MVFKSPKSLVARLVLVLALSGSLFGVIPFQSANAAEPVDSIGAEPWKIGLDDEPIPTDTPTELPPTPFLPAVERVFIIVSVNLSG